MTPQQLRELDAWIAVNIEGFVSWTGWSLQGHRIIYPKGHTPHDFGGAEWKQCSDDLPLLSHAIEGYWRQVPHYSTNDTDALRLWQAGWNVFKRHHGFDIVWQGSHIVEGPTLALTLSLGAKVCKEQL